jgi:penicillin-binding protein 2
VAHGAEWTAQLREFSSTVRIPSQRGEIKDRNGLTLVQNRASYEVFIFQKWWKGYRKRFGFLDRISSGYYWMPKDQKELTLLRSSITASSLVERSDLARDYNAGKPRDTIATIRKSHFPISKTSISMI